MGRGGGGGIGLAIDPAAGKTPPVPGRGGGIGIGREGDGDTGREDGDARDVATAAEEEGAPAAGGGAPFCAFSLSVGDERGGWGGPRKHASGRSLVASKRNRETRYSRGVVPQNELNYAELDSECDRGDRAFRCCKQHQQLT